MIYKFDDIDNLVSQNMVSVVEVTNIRTYSQYEYASKYIHHRKGN